MLNRRDLFKGVALVSGAAAIAAPAVAEDASVVRVPPPRVRRPAIPDGSLVGLGYKALLAVFRGEVQEERVVMFYMTWTDFQDMMLVYVQDSVDNGKTPVQNLNEVSDFFNRVQAKGNISELYDHYNNSSAMLDDWPVEKLGMWQAHPFVARKDYKPGKWAKRSA